MISSTNEFGFAEHTIYARCGTDTRMVAQAATQFLEGVDIVFCPLIDEGRHACQQSVTWVDVVNE
jgi:hypothetical protein